VQYLLNACRRSKKNPFSDVETVPRRNPHPDLLARGVVSSCDLSGPRAALACFPGRTFVYLNGDFVVDGTIVLSLVLARNFTAE